MGMTRLIHSGKIAIEVSQAGDRFPASRGGGNLGVSPSPIPLAPPDLAAMTTVAGIGAGPIVAIGQGKYKSLLVVGAVRHPGVPVTCLSDRQKGEIAVLDNLSRTG